jgi:hypothetical protein
VEPESQMVFSTFCNSLQVEQLGTCLRLVSGSGLSLNLKLDLAGFSELSVAFQGLHGADRSSHNLRRENRRIILLLNAGLTVVVNANKYSSHVALL